MRRLILYIILLSALCSCKNDCSTDNAMKIMGSWFKKKIEFPPQLELINRNGIPEKYWTKINTEGSKFYVVHFFTADCDKCINELVRAQQFISKKKANCNLQYIFIASGPTNVYVTEAVTKSGFTLPVYYEKEYFSFKKINKFPMMDKLYDTMLINDKGEILLFGALFDNEKAEEMFFDIINCSKCPA